MYRIHQVEKVDSYQIFVSDLRSTYILEIKFSYSILRVKKLIKEKLGHPIK